MRRYVAVVAVITAAAILAAGCLPAPDLVTPGLEERTGENLDPYETVPAPQATGTPDAALWGATAEGYAAAVEGYTEGAPPAVNRCPSVRDMAMPPCTSGAGNTGSYAAAAYRCVAGMGKIKDFQFPSLRTCMDGDLVLSSYKIPYTSTFFYGSDLYRYWRYAQLSLDYWWYLVDLYVEWWAYHTSFVSQPYICMMLVGASSLTGAAAGLASYACGTALGVHNQVIAP